MNPLEQVNNYLHSLERRLRWGACHQGAAITALAALVATVLLVLYTNAYAFSDISLRIARVLLCHQLALAIGFGLLLPLLSLNRRRAARRAESAMPEFNERLLTFAEKNQQDDPFLELLAADTMEVAQSAASRTGSSARPGCSVPLGCRIRVARPDLVDSFGVPASWDTAHRFSGPALRAKACARGSTTS